MCLCEWAKLSEIQNDVFVDFRSPYWCLILVHQHGIPIKSSIKLCETFQKIDKKRYAGQTWDLDRLYTCIYESFSWLLPLNGFKFIAKTLYTRESVSCHTIQVKCVSLTFNAEKMLASHLKILASKCWRCNNREGCIHCKSYQQC